MSTFLKNLFAYTTKVDNEKSFIVIPGDKLLHILKVTFTLLFTALLLMSFNISMLWSYPIAIALECLWEVFFKLKNKTPIDVYDILVEAFFGLIVYGCIVGIRFM